MFALAPNALTSSDWRHLHYWRNVLHWPSATQMTRMRDFFAAIEWWRLEPAPELVRKPGEDPQRTTVASRAKAGDLLVAYLPENREVILDLQSMSAGLTGHWLNPVNGAKQPIADPVPSAPAFTLGRPDGWAAAALVLMTAARVPRVVDGFRNTLSHEKFPLVDGGCDSSEVAWPRPDPAASFNRLTPCPPPFPQVLLFIGGAGCA